MEGKSDMSLFPVEAYSLDSAFVVEGSTHAFVVGKNDRTKEWKNHGGGWNDSRTRHLVASADCFKEWLMDFVPPGSRCDECGIDFNVNGVCHTYANRELLLARSNADVRNAAKDEYAVVFYGKYGLGIQALKDKLKTSYDRVMKSYNDPYNALNTVYSRLDHAVDDELLAWRLLAIDPIGIDVDGILARSGGLDVARRRLQEQIDARETFYAQYRTGQINYSELQQRIKNSIIDKSGSYLDFLASLNLMTGAQAAVYKERIRALLGRYLRGVQAQLLEAQNNNGIVL